MIVYRQYKGCKRTRSRRDGQGVIDLDHPVIGRLVLGPTVRLHPIADVIDFLEILLPVDDQLVVLPNSSAGFLPASAVGHSFDVFDSLLLAIAANDVPLLVNMFEQLIP